VIVDDGVGVPAATLDEARATAGRIFARAGIRLEWLDRSSAAAIRRALPDEPARRAFLTSLYSLRLTGMRDLGTATPAARTASIGYRGVEAMARGADATPGVLLGHVMAHELGHLLLRAMSHSAAGLMRADMDVTLAAQGRLWFSDEEARAMRAAVGRARARADARP
jgi:hypothetical protein